jgi:hypothetical protein
MAYSDFTLPQVIEQFQLVFHQPSNLFAAVPEVELPSLLQTLLRRNRDLAVWMGSEKARSEFLVAPLLVELKYAHQERISVFSGIRFDVDPAAGLAGWCDFLLARSPNQFYLEAPAVIIIEAKNDNILAGLPQCLAAMVAAQRFNNDTYDIYGAVTTGTQWRFLQLTGSDAFIDGVEYDLDEVRKIYGILTHALQLDTASTPA